MAQSDVVQIAIIGELQGQPWAHVTHWTARTADPPLVPGAVDNIRGAFYAIWKANVLLNLNNACKVKLITAVQLGATYLDPGPPPKMKFTTVYQSAPLVVSDAGTGLLEPLPQFNAWYGRTRTTSGLRRYKGSLHLAGGSENQSTGQFWDATVTATMQTAVDTTYIASYAVTVGASSWTFRYGVMSRKYCLLNGPGSKPWDYTADALSVQMSRRVGSETRRKTRQNP